MFNIRPISREARAVITGAGSGIGRAFSLELARRGGEVPRQRRPAALDELLVGLLQELVQERAPQLLGPLRARGAGHAQERPEPGHGDVKASVQADRGDVSPFDGLVG